MRHQHISFLKSGIRIAGYVLLAFEPITGLVVLVISEIIGIAEEIGCQ